MLQGQPADFNVWTREAGHGSLAISVEGPSKAVVDFKDRKDGSCHVSYTVEEPGEYAVRRKRRTSFSVVCYYSIKQLFSLDLTVQRFTLQSSLNYQVGIRFNEQHIPGSPYRVYIQPSADEADRVRLDLGGGVLGEGSGATVVKPDAPQTMLLNMNGASGNMECRIVAPSGREDDCFITPLGNGEHSVRRRKVFALCQRGHQNYCITLYIKLFRLQVRFVPKEEGVHYLHARFNGVHIPGSPYKIIVGNVHGNDPSTVEVFGKGVQVVGEITR